MSLQYRINLWQRRTFPGGSLGGALIHMGREILEAQDAVEARQFTEAQAELADVVILAFGCAGIMGFDLMDAVEAKFKQNQLRQWGPPDAYGVVEHIRD